MLGAVAVVYKSCAARDGLKRSSSGDWLPGPGTPPSDTVREGCKALAGPRLEQSDPCPALPGLPGVIRHADSASISQAFPT